MRAGRMVLGWGRSPRRRLLVGALVLVGTAVVAAVAVRAGVSRLHQPAPLADQSRPGPVILVPGFGGSHVALNVLADRIRATGRPVTVLTLPGDGTGDLVAQAAALQGEARRESRNGPVDLIGYSAGGVVVRLWLDQYHGERIARRVVSLGAPLHGTRLAAGGDAIAPGACPVACQQLVPGSALLTGLAAHPLPAGLPWLSVWTTDDQTVTPPESALLPGAVNVAVQSVCPGVQVQHGQLPTDPVVTGLVLRAIGTAPIGTPDRADCAALRAAGAGPR
jgi:triacylglycerol lipase